MTLPKCPAVSRTSPSINPPPSRRQEALDATSGYDSKIDVYSFAIVVWEVLERRIPFETNADFPDSMLLAIREIRGGVRPKEGAGCEAGGAALVALMRRCWESDPTVRPEFVVIADELTALRAGLGDGGGDEISLSVGRDDGTLLR